MMEPNPVQTAEIERLHKEVERNMDLYEEELILRKQTEGESKKIDAENAHLRARVASLLAEMDELQSEKRLWRQRRERYEKERSS